mmetsp:Transcript_41808/g.76405  ORF Transcript_41808/g.76405 Transcript_41808/m.76405 type:complete len:84 (-) Transcript_41808:199-450(-)|eukprot:CAMPEP_0201868922 /NCGR_PEP_ID=MMETSP0902-20130614/2628_1 /ASSEMBLY_ACC=CAM_ASM_000551 /TAXON_ID=420261 /ORGANISM="Thalassiosira antarctica, Strain CCMP982" /LENGTH=83 /DNA_ID=CAMNT_0048394335 /DNA_START=215 /DNA_END=466 /DNA_ORIENTATION=-
MGTPFPPGLGGETVDDSEDRVLGGFARGAADDDDADIAEDGGLVVVGLGACSGVEAESACDPSSFRKVRQTLAQCTPAPSFTD